MKDEHEKSDAHPQPEETRKSKTRRKKEMIDLQKLGERLLVLPEGYLKRSGIPVELLDAVLATKKITSFGARKRQKQYIGAIMRRVEPEFIKRVLDEFGQGSMEHAADEK